MRRLSASLRHLAPIATVAAGVGGSIALIATVGDRSTSAAMVLQLGAAALALFGGLLAMFELHRSATRRAARGRTTAARAGGGLPQATAAVAIAAGLFAITLGLTATVEAVAIALEDSSEQVPDRGVEALRRAIEREAGTVASAPTAGGGPRSDVVGPSPGGLGEGSAREAAIGNLLSDEPILRVEYVAPVESAERRPVLERSLHLRGFVIDSFDGAGVWRERGGSARVVSDGADGTRDGSLTDPFHEAEGRESEGVGDRPGTELELDVRFVGSSNGLVFAPATLTSVDVPEASYEPRSVSLVAEDRTGYRVRSRLVDLSLAELRSASAAGSLPAGHVALALPPTTGRSEARQAMRTLEGYARLVAADAATDADRVLRIVTHLRTEFGYEIYDVGFLSPAGCSVMIDRGSGSCTHFASLAALLLRSLGIPTRIAAGYVAREPLEDAPGWLARARDGHAWIEVHFEGHGWLPFDPTPGDPSVGGAARDWSPLSDLSESGAEGARRVGTSAVGALLVDSIGTLVRATARGAASVPTGAWLIGGALALVGLVRLFGGRRGEARRDAAGEREVAGAAEAGAPAVPALTELLDALAARGWVQGPSSTPMAFARRIERLDPDARGLRTVMRAAIGFACTGHWTEPGDEKRIRRFAVTLREADDLSRSEPERA